ncbi:hypothetical protein BH09DEP1_BH09DEP1_1130 [soil metagenome]
MKLLFLFFSFFIMPLLSMDGPKPLKKDKGTKAVLVDKLSLVDGITIVPEVKDDHFYFYELQNKSISNESSCMFNGRLSNYKIQGIAELPHGIIIALLFARKTVLNDNLVCVIANLKKQKSCNFGYMGGFPFIHCNLHCLADGTRLSISLTALSKLKKEYQKKKVTFTFDAATFFETGKFVEYAFGLPEKEYVLEPAKLRQVRPVQYFP